MQLKHRHLSKMDQPLCLLMSHELRRSSVTQIKIRPFSILFVCPTTTATLNARRRERALLGNPGGGDEDKEADGRWLRVASQLVCHPAGCEFQYHVAPCCPASSLSSSPPSLVVYFSAKSSHIGQSPGKQNLFEPSFTLELFLPELSRAGPCS